MKNGWTWFSLNVQPEDTNVNTVLDSLVDKSAGYIKTINEYSDY